MSALIEVLDSRAAFMLSALAVTWVAFGLLALVAAHLHVRLRRLERRGAGVAPPSEGLPFARLVGGDATALFGRETDGTRVYLLLSSACRSCARILDELAHGGLVARTAVAWTDGPPGTVPPLPGNATVLDGGPDLARRVGVRVTPFVIVADDHGTITGARPITGIAELPPALRADPRDREPAID
jgi:hypothetical protein